MTREQLQGLQPGDIIRHKHAAEAMVVTANYGTRAIAVRTADVSNPDEWDIIDRFETGGVVAPGLFIMGDRGPEMIGG